MEQTKSLREFLFIGYHKVVVLIHSLVAVGLIYHDSYERTGNSYVGAAFLGTLFTVGGVLAFLILPLLVVSISVLTRYLSILFSLFIGLVYIEHWITTGSSELYGRTFVLFLLVITVYSGLSWYTSFILIREYKYSWDSILTPFKELE